MMGGRKPQDHSRRKFREKWAGCDLWQRLYKVNGLKYGFVWKDKFLPQPRPHLVPREVVTVGDDGDHLIWQQIIKVLKNPFIWFSPTLSDESAVVGVQFAELCPDLALSLQHKSPDHLTSHICISRKENKNFG